VTAVSLFGWLPQCCLSHGVKIRWHDRVRKDLKHFGISESDWYVATQDKDKWSQLCVPSPSLSEPGTATVVLFIDSKMHSSKE